MKRKQKTFLISIILTGIIINVPITYGQINNIDDFPLNPDDERVLQAVDFLYSHQDETGKIKGLTISSWAAMSLSIIDRNDSRFLELTHYLATSTTLVDLDKATELARHILALVACNINPENINQMNLTQELIELYDGAQIGDPANIYDDIFGMLALISTGISQESSIISQLTETILSKQRNDGSWGDVDTTASAIMALISSGMTNQSSVFVKAALFLRSNQGKAGGFISWGSENSASTSWAVSALTALNIDVSSTDWMQNDSNPTGYLLSLQNPDGSFNYTKKQSTNTEWMTAYALMALCGKNLPIRIQERNSNTDSDSSDDQEDNINDSPNQTNLPQEDWQYIDKTVYEGVYVLHPHQQGIYFMNKKTRFYFDSLIVIGPIDLTIDVTESVDKVIFYFNDICIGEDIHPPYSITVNQKASPITNTIIVQAIKYNQSFYQANSDYYLPQIVDNMIAYLCNNNMECYQNLSEMRCEMDQNHIDQIYQTEISMIVMSMPMISKILVS